MIRHMFLAFILISHFLVAIYSYHLLLMHIYVNAPLVLHSYYHELFLGVTVIVNKFLPETYGDQQLFQDNTGSLAISQGKHIMISHFLSIYGNKPLFWHSCCCQPLFLGIYMVLAYIELHGTSLRYLRCFPIESLWIPIKGIPGGFPTEGIMYL